MALSVALPLLVLVPISNPISIRKSLPKRLWRALPGLRIRRCRRQPHPRRHFVCALAASLCCLAAFESSLDSKV